MIKFIVMIYILCCYPYIAKVLVW